jgi:hypothetical protein
VTRILIAEDMDMIRGALVAEPAMDHGEILLIFAPKGRSCRRLSQDVA